jgi:hypothetical protein
LSFSPTAGTTISPKRWCSGRIRSTAARPGSATLYFDPDDPDHGWKYALLALGVTDVVEAP